MLSYRLASGAIEPACLKGSISKLYFEGNVTVVKLSVY